MATASWNGQIIAESNDIVVVEGNRYFPRESIGDVLVASDRTSSCPWKGTANYFSIEVGGETNTDAAWYYASPLDAAKEIAGRVAFWKGVEIID